MRVVILCNGRQKRLPELEIPKQFLLVNDEPILQRTVRLVQEHVERPSIWIVGPASTYREFAATNRLAVHEPMIPCGCVLDTIYHSRGLWATMGKTVVLLGDVVYSRFALSTILHDDRSLAFAVTPILNSGEGEVFAFWFYDWMVERLVRELEVAPCRAVPYEEEIVRTGHLRKLLWIFQERNRVPLVPRRSYSYQYVLPVSDWTSDVDDATDVAGLDQLTAHVQAEEQR